MYLPKRECANRTAHVATYKKTHLFIYFFFYLNNIYYSTTFALRAKKKAHPESLCCLQCLSHVWLNYWTLIGWERGHFGIFLLITRALLVIKRAGLLDADWLCTPALSWIPASNGFRKGISETFCFRVWSKHGCFNLTWKKINMQQSAVFWWKGKTIFPSKNVLIRSLKQKTA